MRENKLLLGRLLPPFVTGLPLTNQQFRVGLWPILWEFLKPASSFDWPWTDGLTDGRGLLILVLCSVIFNHRVTNQRFFERRVLITRYQILCRLELQTSLPPLSTLIVKLSENKEERRHSCSAPYLEINHNCSIHNLERRHSCSIPNLERSHSHSIPNLETSHVCSILHQRRVMAAIYLN